MAEIETVTISAVNYSVYGLGNADPVGDADDYFAGRLGASAWTSLTTDGKAQALITAFRMMNRRPTWSGTVTVSGQVGAWPRDGATCGTTEVPDGTIPDNIAYGEFELALALAENEEAQDSLGIGSNIKRVKAGPAEVEFFTPTLDSSQDLQFPVVVHELISCYFAGSTGLSPLITGTDPTQPEQASSFDCDDQYGLSEGYS